MFTSQYRCEYENLHQWQYTEIRHLVPSLNDISSSPPLPPQWRYDFVFKTQWSEFA